MKDVSSLKKKLAQYSAMAGVVLAANHQTSDAQVIYHDIVPDTFITNQDLAYYLDMNNDGITDYSFHGDSIYGGVSLFCSNDNSCMMGNGYSNYIAAIGSCQEFSAFSPATIFVSVFCYWTAGNHDFPILPDWGGVFSPWQQYGTDKFIGVKLHLNDGNHYGWIRASHHHISDTLFIQDYAYEAIPDSAILTPCATPVKDVAASNLFNAFVEDHHLIIHLHQSPLASRVILFDEVGVRMNEQTITQSELVMDVSRLPAGIYFVEVIDGEQRQVKKVIIE